MSTIRARVRKVALSAAMSGAALFAGGAAAQSVIALTPNLKPLPASNFSLVSNVNGGYTLRFSTTSWNSGGGPLQLEAGPVDTGSGKQQVYQRIFNSDGSSALFFAGWFQWHPTHNHFHFDDYALYTLQPVNAPGGSQRTGSKTTFCVMDTTKIDTSLPGAPAQAVYATCGVQLQGMSVGWGDTYGAHLSGQEIDFTDNPDGIYQLKITVDPNRNLVESNKNDNESCALVSIRKPNTVSVLDASGSCSTVTSITPNSAKMGTTVQVTITGYSFAPGTTVTFEGGNGPRPVASNVVLASDTDGLDTITATVTVPPKKQLGKNPVWDVRV
ncbi:MAG TPA: lysyl oxidase family protein, partial [Burkholderiaceae bacterium]|nr:lysyl oxidase family protein [Burkholderiaceae bacterium]